MPPRWTRPCGLLLGIALSLALFLSALDWACFDRAFYRAHYADLRTAQSIGISEEDLRGATERLLDYIQLKAPNLDYEILLLNEAPPRAEPMFNTREVAHMADVRALYRGAMAFRAAMLLLAGLCLAGIALRRLRGRRAWRASAWRALRQGQVLGLAALAAALAAVGVWALVDFQGFWTRFHLLVFDNDLWILNPATDRLILMVPQAFFSALVERIVAASLLVLLLANAALFTLFTLFERRDRHAHAGDV